MDYCTACTKELGHCSCGDAPAPSREGTARGVLGGAVAPSSGVLTRQMMDEALERLSSVLGTAAETAPVETPVVVLDDIINPIPDNSAILACVQQAIADERVIRIDYRNDDGERSDRKVLPLEICRNGSGQLYFSAYCKTRESLRNFRVDRILAILPRQ